MSVTLSCEACPEAREYERTSTAIANAYVQPLMAGYLRRLERALAELGYGEPIHLMTSGGSLASLETAARFPVRLVEFGAGRRRHPGRPHRARARRAPHAVLRHGRHDRQDLPDRGRRAAEERARSRWIASRASRRAAACRCAFPSSRWWRSAPAAARSRASTACSASWSGPRVPAPSRVPPATAAAAPSRP